MLNKSKGKFTVILVVLALLALAGCGGQQKLIHLQPGEQVAGAEVDTAANSVVQKSEKIIVKVKAAMMPIEHKNDLYPTFWVTVENTGKNKVTLQPAQARLIDSFGNQYEPLPVSVKEGEEIVDGYWVPDPLFWGRFSTRLGSPSYYMSPYPRRIARGRMRGVTFYAPFWRDPYFNRVWVERVKIVGTAGEQPEKTETIYSGAKLTYVLVFEQLSEYVETVRLIVPEVTLSDNEQSDTMDFEIVFDQVITVASK